MLKWWSVSADGTKPETTIIASQLLNALLAETAVTELFIALPLNQNGAAGLAVDPFAPFQAATAPNTLPSNAMLNLLLQNFCARVIVPSPAQ